MSASNNPISVTYPDEKLRILVEEYITQQKNEFTFKGVCAYILYWAMEDGKVVKQNTLRERNQLAETDCDRIHQMLAHIVNEGRIAAASNSEQFEKLMS